MPNIQLNYQYRDYANYKNYNEVVFSNPDNLTLEHIVNTLLSKCMDNEYFLASQWHLPDLHFEKYNAVNDHPWHEFIGVEFTDEPITETITITELLAIVQNSTWVP